MIKEIKIVREKINNVCDEIEKSGKLDREDLLKLLNIIDETEEIIRVASGRYREEDL